MWHVIDKWGNQIELTDERWQHILENHWELRNHFNEILLTVRTGRRKQAPMDPFKYTYYKDFENLPYNYTRIVVIVKLIHNNFIITAISNKKKELNMKNVMDELKIVYDQDADVLYVTRGKPEYTDYVEYADDIILRFHPDTKQLVGFTLIDFSQHFANKESHIALPFSVDFHMHGELPVTNTN